MERTAEKGYIIDTMGKNRRCAIFFLASLLVTGCYNPSLDGPGGFICEKGKVCPEGYKCCPRPGTDVCLPEGQCKSAKQDKSTADVWPDSKPPNKKDKGNAKDQSKPKKEQGVKPDQQTTKKDTGGSTAACGYLDVASKDLLTGGRTFAAVVDASGEPEVFYITKAGKVTGATRKTNWKPKVEAGFFGTSLAVDREANGEVHLAYAFKMTTTAQLKYLTHAERRTGTTGFKGSQVFQDTIGGEVDMAAGPSSPYIASVQPSGAKRFWRVSSGKWGGSSYNYNTIYSLTATSAYSSPRLASGKVRWISTVHTPSYWRVVTRKHGTSPDEKAFTVAAGKDVAPMSVAMDDTGNAWVAYVQYTSGSTVTGNLYVAQVANGDTKLSKKGKINLPNAVVGSSVSIALNSSGLPYLAWIEHKSGGMFSARWTRKKSTGGWSGPHLITSKKSLVGRTHLVVAQKSGNAHVSFPVKTGELYHACRTP